MRQLVSVVTDEHVSYFVHDDGDDEAQQIAQVINPGFDVAEIVELGASLTTVLHLNGKRPKKAAALTEPAPAVAVTPELTARGTPRRRKASPRRRDWGTTTPGVLADVRAHPDSTTFEIATRLLDDTTQAAQQAINNALHRLRDSGHVIYGERPGVSQHGHQRALRTVRAT